MHRNGLANGDCRASRSIAVTPPVTAATKRMPVSVNLCGLTINPVVKGKTGT